MTRAITPKTVLRAIDRKVPWYYTDINGKIKGTTMPFKKYCKIMIDEKVSYNERTIRYHWNKLKEYGFCIEIYDEEEGTLIAEFVPSLIAKELGIVLTNWVPPSMRFKSRWPQ